MAKLLLNGKQLQKQLRKNVFEPALTETVAEFEQALREAIESAVYFWDRPTVRSDGSRVSSPRDIVDTGALRDSQQANQTSAVRWQIAWTVAYAAFVYLGGVRRSDGTVTPGRDWVGEALTNFSPVESFASSCRKRLPEK
jgi:hypothetical protein